MGRVISSGPFEVARMVSSDFVPVMDGFQVLRVLRERAETKGLPVIMLTARAAQGDMIGGLDAGADDAEPHAVVGA